MSSTATKALEFYNDTNLGENFVKIKDTFGTVSKEIGHLTQDLDALHLMVHQEFDLYSADIQTLANRISQLAKKVDKLQGPTKSSSFGKSVLVGAAVVLGVKLISENRTAIKKKLDELSAWAEEQQAAERTRTTS